MSEDSPVIMFKGDDEEMARASQQARETFRYFWRELSWERRRIVPGLDVSIVKAAFTDEPDSADSADVECEHMWIHEVGFNGDTVTGILGNAPNWLKSVSEGDEVKVPMSRLSDWLYAIRGRAYGGFTVNLLRLRMSKAERAEHDAVWGIDFGDPDTIDFVPEDFAGKPSGGFLKRLFSSKPKIDPVELAEREHPMSANMGDSLREFLTTDPEQVSEADENGWTMLHHRALAGSATSVAILLELGADRNAKTSSGQTAASLAEKTG
jgi:uncharacterized protein YegJ (DUF2314 family)